MTQVGTVEGPSRYFLILMLCHSGRSFCHSGEKYCTSSEVAAVFMTQLTFPLSPFSKLAQLANGDLPCIGFSIF